MKGAKFILAAAALYNLLIGGTALVGSHSTNEGRIVGLLVACFGMVYAIVATDAERFKPILWAGVVGKAGVVLLVWSQVQAGLLPGYVGLVLLGDILFMVAFLAILVWPAQRPASE
ncbi:hypothetical protein [Erythrobacter sp. HKB08]|uniref:hypothetical protein n=1 Tax=Erythrobacter sp. HKB08 TaxID=2502843 RepID=UPI0010092483|nr:hypothetical protein [Erythrobacter sp. HKB08]